MSESMPLFFFTSAGCINVSNINIVDFKSSASGDVISLTVWQAGGGQRKFTGDEAKELLAFLRKHRVE